jgi:hypothetical protein
MYWRTMLMGAPLQEESKWLGDQSTPFQYRWGMLGRCRRSKRLKTPLRLFTSEGTPYF